MDEALYMARDVVECMYEIKRVIVELVVPPDVSTAFERRRVAKRGGKLPRRTKVVGAAKLPRKAVA